MVGAILNSNGLFFFFFNKLVQEALQFLPEAAIYSEASGPE